MDIKVSASILAADFSNLGEELRSVKNADQIHIDVMDGHFVDNLTFGPMIIRAMRKESDQIFQAHLAIENCEKYLSDYIEAGADIILVHPEVCHQLNRTLREIKELGAQAGVAISPSTPLSSIKYFLSEIDMVSVMTVDPGFGGQKFIEGILYKIQELRRLIDHKNLKIDVQVDGGIKPETTAKKCVEAGANVLAAGTAIFDAEDRRKAIKNMRNLEI